MRLPSVPVTISLLTPPKRSGLTLPTGTPLGTHGRPIRRLALKGPVSIPLADWSTFTLAGTERAAEQLR